MQWVILQAITMPARMGRRRDVSDLVVGTLEAPDRLTANALAREQWPRAVVRCVSKVSFDQMAQETAARKGKPWWYVKRPRGAQDVLPPDATRDEKRVQGIRSHHEIRRDKVAQWIEAARAARGIA